jgi:ATP-binding cassette subfamily B protein
MRKNDAQQHDRQRLGGASKTLLWRLLRYGRRYVPMMVLTFVLIVGMTVLFNYLPVLIRNAIDGWIDNKSLEQAARIRGTVRIGVLYLLLAAVGGVFRYLQSLAAAWTGQRIVRDIRDDVYRKALRMPRRYFDTTPVGKIMTRVTSDVDVVQQFVTQGVVGSLADVFMLLGVLVFMVYLSPLLALTLFGIMPLMIILFVFANKRLRHANREIRTAQSALNANTQESLSGMSTIQLFNRQRFVREMFGEYNEALRRASFQEVRWFSFYFPVLEFTQALSTILVLGAGGGLIMYGKGQVTLGVLVAFLAYVRDFFRPLDSLSNKLGTLQQALAACERIFDLLDRDEQVSNPESPVTFHSIQGELEFDHVSFAYDDVNWVIRDLSFRIKPRESLAIVGATGSGKTTIINLLARYYDVQQGQVKIDGVDVRRYVKEEVRRHIGIVVQEPFIFSGSVADNISLHDPGISRAQIEQAARYVNAHTFIERMPHGLDTVLNERGGGLSAGQKQLLALARAMAQNRDAILVLDEATANVDSETEQLIQDALQRIMQDRTCIIIAHRLSTIKHVDRILVMYQGRLAASGSHEQLIRQDGYYRRLYEYLSISSSRRGD